MRVHVHVCVRVNVRVTSLLLRLCTDLYVVYTVTAVAQPQGLSVVPGARQLVTYSGGDRSMGVVPMAGGKEEGALASACHDHASRLLPHRVNASVSSVVEMFLASHAFIVFALMVCVLNVSRSASSPFH